ncbi:MAG: 1-acyl-sn-glycerol-3-phosphate acyltransferase [Phycisphaerales bacterium]|nr:1-acyl-sn-glycerol-3-phosphate acyltransferase [Phycisphaerales bacterium]
MLNSLQRRIRSGAVMGGIHLLATLFVRFVHRLRVEGVPDGRVWANRAPGAGLIVVANHVSGIDPVLIQVAFPREIRWMMDRAMMLRSLAFFWRFLRIIAVDTEGAKTSVGAIRESLRHLQAGGVLGIFPEGQIARPPGVIHPFLPGMASLAARSGAQTVLFVIDGVPACKRAFIGIIRPSRARVRMIGVIDPPRRGEEVAWTAAIRLKMAQTLGYPTTDRLTGDSLTNE